MSISRSTPTCSAAHGTVDPAPRVPETLPSDVLSKMHAPGQDTSIPFITPAKLTEYDGFLMGVPTRYGNFPTQLKAFWDQAGQVWASGGLQHKYGAMFVSTAGPGGGQESTVISCMSTFAHHGVIFVPLGYKNNFGQLTNLEEVHGGSPWGAGTFAVGCSGVPFHYFDVFSVGPRLTWLRFSGQRRKSTTV